MGRIRCARLGDNRAHWIGEPVQVKQGYPLLIKFWDSTCLNCLRSMEWLEAVHEIYSSRGLAVVGVHTPEFSFAADPTYVRWRVQSLDVRFPVQIDSHRATWEAFANRAWPSYWLVNAEGYVVGEWVGEGQETQIEKSVRDLLRTTMTINGDVPKAVDQVDLRHRSCLPTTEWYGGFRAWENGQIVNTSPIAETATNFFGGDPGPSGYAMRGPWLADRESWTPLSRKSRILIRPHRARLGVVAGPGKLAWSAPFLPREQLIMDRPQFIDLGLVLPGDIVTLELEPEKARLYSIVQSFG